MTRQQPRWPDLRLQERLRTLWSEIFGDTDAYISLVFQRVYRQSLTRWKTSCKDSSDNLIAMLFATPYIFTDKRTQTPLTGVYLSGLATDEAYRRQGVMGAMIEDFIVECVAGHRDDVALGDKPDFLFLIPANSHLRDYYARFGFVSSGERAMVEIASAEQSQDYGAMRIVELDEVSPEDRTEIFARISQYEKSGRDYGCLQISHSHQAISTAIAESVQNEGKVVLSADGFLWANYTPDGVVCRVWSASTVRQLLAMIQRLRDAQHTDNQPVSCCKIKLYGAMWQIDLLQQMHEAGRCSIPQIQPYAMILPLKNHRFEAALSIELMLD